MSSQGMFVRTGVTASMEINQNVTKYKFYIELHYLYHFQVVGTKT